VGDVLPRMFYLPMAGIRVGEHTLRFSVVGGNDSEHGDILAHFSMLNAQRPSAPQGIRIGAQ
jgi:hypothetical protein